ncbi:hypothetical protein F0562_030489 [Nyssa sinensis]|uniref:Xylose isomerase n=1 Tax=Nyssa sinensis TaxID=561372 RepID=A0A5J5AZX9_9ASTE|nr:hypothetical protein F0562_030489 [Nyssa sinensis]
MNSAAVVFKVQKVCFYRHRHRGSYFTLIGWRGCLHEMKKMKTGMLFLFFLCLNVVIAAVPPSCPADIGNECSASDSGEWEGEFFPDIPKIKYEGPSSKNTLAFKWYNAEEEILGKKMKDWMRFSVAFWHTFRGTGGDPFGAPTKMWPWEDGTNSLAMAKRRMRANFEFLRKLGVEWWCFHDRDIAPDGKTLEEANANLDEVVALAKELQGTKIRPLWGTAQLFFHPRYMHGGATSSEVGVYAYAAAQVKKAMEVTHYLGGENYVFWGGREGYQTLLNTDMERELNHLARFMEAAVAYKKKIGFNGTLCSIYHVLSSRGHFLLNRSLKNPPNTSMTGMPQQAANFLRKYGLIGEFKLNIECNHATLSGHSCHHELETARINGLLGNIDANTGDPQIGWDTDQFLMDIAEATMVMQSVVRNGGLAPGGFNFDSKLRRESTDVEDLFIAHIAGMDTLARGLRNVAKLIEDGSLAELVRKRYQSFDTEIGAQIEAGKADFDMLEKKAMEWGEPKVPSAKQELAEMIFQSAFYREEDQKNTEAIAIAIVMKKLNRLYTAIFIAILQLLGASYAVQSEDLTPTPLPWPERFHALLYMNLSTTHLQINNLWYDWPKGRNVNIFQKQLGVLQYDIEWNNGTSFYYTFGANATCETIYFGVGIPRPDFLDGAIYLGTAVTDGFLCNVWEKVDFIWYYEDVYTKQPVRWDFYDGISTHVITFEVGAALPDSITQAPAYCFTQEKDTRMLKGES